MPEMSVVRFTESDVIVASLIVVSYGENDGAHNLTITRNDKTILYNNNSSQHYDPYLSDDGYGDNPQFVFRGDNPFNYSLSTMIENDNNGNPLLGINGEYLWVGGQFVKQ